MDAYFDAMLVNVIPRLHRLLIINSLPGRHVFFAKQELCSACYSLPPAQLKNRKQTVDKL